MAIDEALTTGISDVDVGGEETGGEPPQVEQMQEGEKQKVDEAEEHGDADTEKVA